MKNRNPQLLPIRIYGDRTLRQTAKPVTEFTAELQDFIADLTHTMYEKDGVGLAAPQVGISKRIFVIDAFWFQEGGSKNPVVLINPEFLEFEGQEENEEGCLSLPEIYEKVVRAKKVKIKGLNENGKEVLYEADELFARALQHENDHLNGVLFIDKIPRLKRLFLKKKLHEMAESTDENGINIGKQNRPKQQEL